MAGSYSTAQNAPKPQKPGQSAYNTPPAQESGCSIGAYTKKHWYGLGYNYMSQLKRPGYYQHHQKAEPAVASRCASTHGRWVLDAYNEGMRDADRGAPPKYNSMQVNAEPDQPAVTRVAMNDATDQPALALSTDIALRAARFHGQQAASAAKTV